MCLLNRCTKGVHAVVEFSLRRGGHFACSGLPGPYLCHRYVSHIFFPVGHAHIPASTWFCTQGWCRSDSLRPPLCLHPSACCSPWDSFNFLSAPFLTSIAFVSPRPSRAYRKLLLLSDMPLCYFCFRDSYSLDFGRPSILRPSKLLC